MFERSSSKFVRSVSMNRVWKTLPEQDQDPLGAFTVIQSLASTITKHLPCEWLRCMGGFAFEEVRDNCCRRRASLASCSSRRGQGASRRRSGKLYAPAPPPRHTVTDFIHSASALLRKCVICYIMEHRFLFTQWEALRFSRSLADGGRDRVWAGC